VLPALLHRLEPGDGTRCLTRITDKPHIFTCTGPLLASSNLHSALAAMHVCSVALAALASTSSALDSDKQVEEEMVEAQGAQVGGVGPAGGADHRQQNTSRRCAS
jgi:hypothetical protein